MIGAQERGLRVPECPACVAALQVYMNSIISGPRLTDVQTAALVLEEHHKRLGIVDAPHPS